MRASSLLATLALAGACGPRSAAPPPSTAPATTAACDRLADHLVRLLEADLRAAHLPAEAAQSQRSNLRDDCTAHADALTADCLLSARTLQETARCDDLDPALQPPAIADALRPSARECEQYAAHAVALLETQLLAQGLDPQAAQDARAKIRATCMGEATRSSVECGLATTSVAELERC